MAGRNLSDVVVPSIDALQSWANDQDLARTHLKELFATIQSEQEEPVNWATEAFENMGPPLKSDIVWLGEIASNDSPDVVYWAVTLLGRSEDSVDSVQGALTRVFMAAESTPANRRRAILALAKVHTRNSSTEFAIQSAMNSNDSQLVSVAKEILQST